MNCLPESILPPQDISRVGGDFCRLGQLELFYCLPAILTFLLVQQGSSLAIQAGFPDECQNIAMFFQRGLIAKKKQPMPLSQL